MSNNISFYTNPSAMEPLFPEDTTGKLEKLATELLEKTSKLSSCLNPITRKAIAEFLRPMNSYYSNLIEGHDTHPIDIAKALKNDYSSDKIKRDLQLEATAHINVKKKIELEINNVSNPYSSDYLKSIHKNFYDFLPESFKTVTTKEGKIKQVIPGEFRKDEVEVGKHIAPYSEKLPVFMQRFEDFYNPSTNANKLKRIISIAVSHHRLAWIHPFLDGNGRVVRLLSDASFMFENLDASGMWSISRGLARDKKKYQSSLANADLKRYNDYDGRGNLSNKMLLEFCDFFLSTAIDQVDFMYEMLDVDGMIERIESFIDLMTVKKKLKKEAKYIMTDVFLKGKITKTDAMRITNTSDKTLKTIIDKLIYFNLIDAKKEGINMVYYVKYPVEFSSVLFPGMYPSDKELEMFVNI